MFVSGVVGGLIVLTGGGVTVRGALMRDVGAYLVATVCVAVMMASGQVGPRPVTAQASSQSCIPDAAWQAGYCTGTGAAAAAGRVGMLDAACLLCCWQAALALTAALPLAAPMDLTGSPCCCR